MRRLLWLLVVPLDVFAWGAVVVAAVTIVGAFACIPVYFVGKGIAWALGRQDWTAWLNSEMRGSHPDQVEALTALIGLWLGWAMLAALWYWFLRPRVVRLMRRRLRGPQPNVLVRRGPQGP